MCTYEGVAACVRLHVAWVGELSSKARLLLEQRGSKARTWALTHTATQGQTDPPRPPSSSLLASVVFKGASVRTVCCAVPPLPAQASSNTLMPSRQLRGGSCLDHLKADGWARICCHPPGSEEVAAPGPGHRLRQMDCLSGHPRTGPGGGQTPR